MPSFRLDGRDIPFREGETILEAAAGAGITIPKLCWQVGFEPSGGCLVCAVYDRKSDRMLPSCAYPALDGLDVQHETEKVHAFRRRSLELLLSDHLAECQALCRRACPADLDVSQMMGLIQMGDVKQAYRVLANAIALPSIVGRLCHRPCEKICRRGSCDATVAIREVERVLADHQQLEPLPVKLHMDGQRVAIVGGGATGLSASWHLLRLGYRCTVFEQQAQPLPGIQGHVQQTVIQREIDNLVNNGLDLRLNSRVGDYDALLASFACVVVATGEAPVGDTILFTDTADTLIDKVAAGCRLAQRLHWGEPERRFSSVLRRFNDEEKAEFLANLNPGPPAAELDIDNLRQEAARCGQCECRVGPICELRQWAGHYKARQRAIPASAASYSKRLDLPALIFEPGKCILCGHCLEVARQGDPPIPLSLGKRGRDTTIVSAGTTTPEHELRRTARQCVMICPTGALRAKAPGDSDPL